NEVKKQPKNFDLWKRLGQKYKDNSELEQAISAFSKALELKPGNKDVTQLIDFCKKDLDFLKSASD
nr:tetratricopeptide repeat protein [Candidatus Sigynarchaeota archaeon]